MNGRKFLGKLGEGKRTAARYLQALLSFTKEVAVPASRAMGRESGKAEGVLLPRPPSVSPPPPHLSVK